MKKLYLLFLSFICLCSLSAFADSPCDREMSKAPVAQYQTPCQKHCHKQCQKSCKKCQTPAQTPCQTPCQKQYTPPCSSDRFLCTNANMNTLFSNMNLSSTQICNAEKIQSKYAQEVLSLNERIQCEKEKLCQLENSCAKWNDKRKQKKLIKKLEKKKKEICKCYEKQFKATLSSMQIKAYKKYRKCR